MIFEPRDRPKKVHEIHSIMFKDAKIDRNNFPIYKSLKHSQGGDLNMEFFLSTEFDFETKNWTSDPGFRCRPCSEYGQEHGAMRTNLIGESFEMRVAPCDHGTLVWW